MAVASVLIPTASLAQIPGQEAQGVVKADRTYGDGPLTAADFKGQPPSEGKLAGTTFQAYLFLDIHWSSKYRTAGRGRNVSAFLTQFQATAVTSAAKSWNKNPDLLDHEQGHFDIAQIYALRLEIKLRKLLAAKKPPSGVGETEEAAVDALNSVLEKEYKTAKAASDEENIEYDRLTTHGTVLEKQRELRHVHQETLKKLAAELKAVRK